jgi:hypothetical protein
MIYYCSNRSQVTIVTGRPLATMISNYDEHPYVIHLSLLDLTEVMNFMTSVRRTNDITTLVATRDPSSNEQSDIRSPVIVG